MPTVKSTPMAVSKNIACPLTFSGLRSFSSDDFTLTKPYDLAAWYTGLGPGSSLLFDFEPAAVPFPVVDHRLGSIFFIRVHPCTYAASCNLTMSTPNFLSSTSDQGLVLERRLIDICERSHKQLTGLVNPAVCPPHRIWYKSDSRARPI